MSKRRFNTIIFLTIYIVTMFSVVIVLSKKFSCEYSQNTRHKVINVGVGYSRSYTGYRMNLQEAQRYGIDVVQKIIFEKYYRLDIQLNKQQISEVQKELDKMFFGEGLVVILNEYSQ